MTCADYQRKLSAYADGELTRWTRWKVHVHVSQCPDCAQLMAELQEADVMMAGFIAETPAPGYVTDAVMRRLPAMPPAWRRPSTVVRAATGVALAGVQILAVYGAYWWGFARGTTMPEPSASHRAGVTSSVGTTADLRGGMLNGPRRSFPITGPSVWGRETYPSTAVTQTISAPERKNRNPLPPLGIPVLQPGGAVR